MYKKKQELEQKKATACHDEVASGNYNFHFKTITMTETRSSAQNNPVHHL
jgi:hypothetical protein